MKKTISLALALTLVFSGTSLLPAGFDAVDTAVTASAAFEYEGFVCEDLVSGEVRITGNKGMSGAVTVPSKIDGKKVKEIASGAFKDNGEITSLYVEEGVVILPQAFSGCVGLESVVIGEGCDVWGVAFENCTSLKSVAVMKDTDVSMGAFDGCDSLESFFCYKDSPADSFCSTLDIDPTYFDDGDISFSGVYDVFEFKAANGWSLLDETGKQIVVYITKYIGGDTHLDVVVPETIMGFPVYEISKDAFYVNTVSGQESIVSVKLPETVKVIDAAAFCRCVNLKSINLENVLSFGMSAFSETSLEKAELNKVLESINAGLFSGTSLTKIALPQNITSIPSDAFSNTKLSEIVIPEKVQWIGSYAFYNTMITDVTIPEAVTQIDEKAFGYGVTDLYDDLGAYIGWEEKKYDDMVIRGYEGTAAEKYAKDNGFEFIPLVKPKFGDVDGDGDTSVQDVLLIQQAIAGWDVGISESVLDVNGDGLVSVDDAILIQQYIAGWDVAGKA